MKNDFLTLIRTRRSIRAYRPDAVPADVLARVLEAGTYAPSAMGEQSATIVAVETKAVFARKGPIMDFLLEIICGMLPSAITYPPPTPASGPISISQSASDNICVSWSTRRTELPSATRSCITALSPLIFDGCRPIEGSSNTYKTPVVRFRTALASCIRCLSPVDNVEAVRSSDR